MTQNNMEVVAGRWLLMKRGLYWRPNSQGYTGLKAEAGRYTDEEVAIYRRQDEREVFVLEAETADEIAPKCWPDVAQRHLQGLLTSAQAEIERAQDALRDVTLELSWCAKQLEAEGYEVREGGSVMTALAKARSALQPLEPKND